MLSEKKVSVIITTYNVEQYIQEAIQSVLKQTYRNIELIIVDDRSIDNTVQLIKQIKDERITLLINEENSGPSFSRNRGIDASKGEFVAILDGDDWWDNRRIEKCLKYFTDEVDVVCDNINFIIDGEDTIRSTLFDEKGITKDKAFQISINEFIQSDLGLFKPIIRKAFLSKNKIKYVNEYWHGEDFLFLIDCLLNGKMLVTPNGYYFYRERKGSLVRNGIKLFDRLVHNTSDYIEGKKDQLSPEINSLLVSRINRHKKLLNTLIIRDEVKSLKLISVMKKLSANPELIPFMLNKIISKR